VVTLLEILDCQHRVAYVSRTRQLLFARQLALEEEGKKVKLAVDERPLACVIESI
jgi:hypothetical protein